MRLDGSGKLSGAFLASILIRVYRVERIFEKNFSCGRMQMMETRITLLILSLKIQSIIAAAGGIQFFQFSLR